MFVGLFLVVDVESFSGETERRSGVAVGLVLLDNDMDDRSPMFDRKTRDGGGRLDMFAGLEGRGS